MALTKIPGELFDVDDLDLSDVGTIALDAIKGEADTDTSITFSGSNVITVKANNANQITFIDGAIVPSTDNDIDLGTSSVEFKDAFFDGTVTSDAFAGPLTGNVTGDVSGSSGSTTGLAATATALATVRTIHGVSFDGTANIDLSEVVSDTVGAMFSSNTETGITATYQDGDNTIDLVVGTLNQDTTGTAATVTGAAQSSITSLGTLTALTVDNLGVNGNTITANSGALNLTPASGSAIVLDGTINVDAGVVTGATSITSTTFVGALSGNANTASAVATSADGQNASLYLVFTAGQTGTQSLRTDLGIRVNPSTNTITADEVSMTTLDIGGTNITATAVELNYVDGVTSAIQTQMDTKASTGKAIAMAIVFG